MGVHRLPNRSALQEGGVSESALHAPAFRWSAGRVYAISFDLDVNKLEQHHPSKDRTAAYGDIRRVFARHGFRGQQGSVYFGHDKTTPVHCVLAVQDASARYPWFKFVVKDIRMLRVEENNDLMPAVNPQADLGLDDGV